PTLPAEGFGIRVGQSPFYGTESSGTATISNNTITNYGRGGVMVRNAGSTATINGNTITGKGPGNNTITQNGIEISFGATATIYGNTVTANGFKNGDTVSVGILLYQAGPGVQVGISGTGNTVSNNDLGIQVIDGTNPVIQYNTVSGSTYSGISTA